MNVLETPFVAGTAETAEVPILGRFLPPLPAGMAAACLERMAPPGSLILDPFGSSPPALIEAARAGYRVVTCANNPILRFLLKRMAGPPSAADLQARLAELASARKGSERLEIHLQSLYETKCQACGQTVQAEAYLWNKGAESPYARIYQCECGDQGERPVTADDLHLLSRLPPSGLQRARALERVAPLNDPVRPDVEEALVIYLARPLYVIFNLLAQLDGLSENSEKHHQLAALLLYLLDEGSSLWGHPETRHRPRQLTVPGQFREANLWLALDRASKAWQIDSNGVKVRLWPEEPKQGEISIHPGRIRDFTNLSTGRGFDACLAIFPRYNQAFWTLSAVWAGWLWGREAVQPLKSALSRHRYDWSWHSQALASVLSVLPQVLGDRAPVAGIIAEAETPFLNAVLVAAEESRLELKTLAVRAESEIAQLTLETGRKETTFTSLSFEMAAKPAVQESLEECGQPAAYLAAGAAALAAAAGQHAFNLKPTVSLGENVTQVTAALRRVFLDRSTFIHYGGGDQSLEAGSWWIRDAENAKSPLADRVEQAVARKLKDGEMLDLMMMDEEICRLFPGVQTPPLSLVKACLASYGVEEEGHPGLFSLRREDLAASREIEIQQITDLVCQIGERLGYRPAVGKGVTWYDKTNTPVYRFFIQASAAVEILVSDQGHHAEGNIIILPGGRASLLSYKLSRDARLDSAAKSGWRFLKFRHLRTLAANPLLDGELWESQLDKDPPEEEAGAMPMF